MPIPQPMLNCLRQAKRAALFTHQRPDPDALGSQAALALLLKKLDIPQVTILNFDAPPKIYTFLQQNLNDIEVTTFTPEWAATQAPQYDTILIVDTCTFQQLEPAADLLKSSREKILAFDHHLSRDNLSDHIHADTSAAAAVEIIWDLAQQLRIPADPALALPLMAGLVADTGWFRFDSVTAHTHQVAADLTPHVNASALYERLQQNETPAKIALTQRALASLTLSAQNKVAIMSLTAQDFTNSNAAQSQTEDLVNIPLSLATVEVSALLAETPEGKIRTSLRSKHHIDVNQIARQFNGGGHAKAAGLRLDGPLASAIQKIQSALEAAAN